MSKEAINFGFALKECRKRKGISQEELALQCDLDRTYISMLERNIKAPTLTTLSKLANSLSVSLVTLISLAENEKKIDQIYSNIKKEKLKFPIMGTAVSCGVPVTEDYKVEKEISLDDLIIEHPKKTFFINATGDSMNPLINHDDTLVFEICSKAKNQDVVLVQIDNSFTVKRFIKNDKNFTLQPDNPLFSSLIIGEEQMVKVCGVLVGLVRKTR